MVIIFSMLKFALEFKAPTFVKETSEYYSLIDLINL